MVFKSTLEKLFDQKRTIPETYRKLFEPAISQWSMHDDRKVGCVPPSVDHIGGIALAFIRHQFLVAEIAKPAIVSLLSLSKFREVEK